MKTVASLAVAAAALILLPAQAAADDAVLETPPSRTPATASPARR